MSGRDERRASCLCGVTINKWTLFMGRKADIIFKIVAGSGIKIAAPVGEVRVLWYLERHGFDGLKTVSRVRCQNCRRDYLGGTRTFSGVVLTAKQALSEKGFRISGQYRTYKVNETGVDYTL